MSSPVHAAPRRLLESSRASAIVVTLLFLAIITVLVVGMFSVMQPEQISANSSFGNARASALCQMACDHAVALISGAIGTAEATGTIPNNPNAEFWASQPGRITVFKNSSGNVDTTNSANLYSVNNSNPTDASTVDLNQPSFGGNYPIASPTSITPNSSGTPPTMQVQWINILQDSSSGATASVSNPIIGRYAFWVDDETAKVDLNTADGSGKVVTTNTNQVIVSGSGSYGFGTPTEVDLQVLTGGSNLISFSGSGTVVAQAIAMTTGAHPYSPGPFRQFNDPSEVLQVGGTSGVASILSGSFYSDNNFDVTAYSRAPETNIFGEPKINLMIAGTAGTAGETLEPGDGMMGPYAYNGVTIAGGTSPSYVYGPIMTELYPSSYPVSTYTTGQLPPLAAVSSTIPLPQYFDYIPGHAATNGNPTTTNAPYALNYHMGQRIANYLSGTNSQGNSIVWPAIPGATSLAGFRGKYTKRQADSIALQIVDLMSAGVYSDITEGGECIPTYLASGFVSGEPVEGATNFARVTQVQTRFSVTNGSPPLLQIQIFVTWYMPFQYVQKNYNFGMGWQWGRPDPTGNQGYYLNFADAPVQGYVVQVSGTNNYNEIPFNPPAPYNGCWQNHQLRIVDQTGTNSAIDLFGQDPSKFDPDSTTGNNTNNDWNLLTGTVGSPLAPLGTGTYGTGPIAGRFSPVMSMAGFCSATNWHAGEFHTARNYYSTSSYPLRPGTTAITISGGFNIWAYDGSSSGFTIIPIESGIGLESSFSNVPYLSGSISRPGMPLLAGTTFIPNAVIPIAGPVTYGGPAVGYKTGSITINGIAASGAAPPPVTVDWQVADPYVNDFPGDWSTPATQPTLPSVSGTAIITYGTSSPTYASSGFLATNNGDPAAFWRPPQDITIPKIQRFPSTGYLQYIHTGVMPDPANEPLDSRYVAGNVPMGTPFRLFNLTSGSNASQATLSGSSYPDWAMLDLFTVPAAFQGQYQPAGTVPNSIILTWGGATSGRLNPNSLLASGSTTSTPGAQVTGSFPFVRTLPLQALANNLQASYSYNAGGVTPIASAVSSSAVASGINTYASGLTDGNGNSRPLMFPGEICNVPAVSQYQFPALSGTSTSRNDLVREIIGNLSTRSNTFTVWAVGQVVKKVPSLDPTPVQYGNFQSGDVVVSESRMKFLIERYIDYGVGGNTPGNSSSIGTDQIPGTIDDVPDSIHNPLYTSYPFHYKYRVVSATQVGSN